MRVQTTNSSFKAPHPSPAPLQPPSGPGRRAQPTVCEGVIQPQSVHPQPAPPKSAQSESAPPPTAPVEAAPRKVGRPSRFEEKTVAQLLEAVRRDGISDTAAARRQGISSSALSRWKQEDPILGPLLESAREEFREAQLAILREAMTAPGRSGWRAAAWLLERVFPGDYGKRSPMCAAPSEHPVASPAAPWRASADAYEASQDAHWAEEALFETERAARQAGGPLRES